VRVGFIGIAGGAANLDQAACIPGVEIAALCDGESPPLARAAARFPAATATPDYRQVLADPSIHAVCISGPAASQPEIAIGACAALKDVWLEPPVCLSLVDGVRVVQAARKYGRIVQAGAARRSDPYIQRVRDIVRSGRLGKVGFCRAAGVPPPGMSPLAGAFEFIDLVQFTGAEPAPLSISVQESPDGVAANFRYAEFIASYETGAPDSPREIEAVFHGTRATLATGRHGYTIYPCDGAGIDYRAPEGAMPRALHWRDFITCIQTRGRPVCEIESYIQTAATCRLAALALRYGVTLDFEGDVLP
jgi:predicted dehydrogenase